MAVHCKCPSCGEEKVQKIGEIFRKQTLSGGKVTLDSQYQPPKQPWAYVHGFLLGAPVNVVIMLSMTSPDSSESTTAVADLMGTVAFLSIWVGYGIWKNKAYKVKLDEWNKTTASKFLCQQCNHVIER